MKNFSVHVPVVQFRSIFESQQKSRNSAWKLLPEQWETVLYGTLCWLAYVRICRTRLWKRMPQKPVPTWWAFERVPPVLLVHTQGPTEIKWATSLENLLPELCYKVVLILLKSVYSATRISRHFTAYADVDIYVKTYAVLKYRGRVSIFSKICKYFSSPGIVV